TADEGQPASTPRSPAAPLRRVAPPAPAPPYPLSLHDALPICTSTSPSAVSTSPADSARAGRASAAAQNATQKTPSRRVQRVRALDRKSTGLNSSHASNSYAVFCLKKKSQTSEVELFDPHPSAT